MINLVKLSSLILITLSLSTTAFAAVGDPIRAGTYKVIKAEGFESSEETFCVVGRDHAVEWVGFKENQTLSIGRILFFGDLNEGLKSDTQPYYKDDCSFSHTTMAQQNHLADDSSSNCNREDTTSHTELTQVGDQLEYVSDMSISRKSEGKKEVKPHLLKLARAKCFLKRIETQPSK